MDHPEQQVLEGQLTLPMPIATKGGSIGLNPSVQVAHELLGNPDALNSCTDYCIRWPGSKLCSA